MTGAGGLEVNPAAAGKENPMGQMQSDLDEVVTVVFTCRCKHQTPLDFATANLNWPVLDPLTFAAHCRLCGFKVYRTFASPDELRRQSPRRFTLSVDDQFSDMVRDQARLMGLPFVEFLQAALIYQLLCWRVSSPQTMPSRETYVATTNTVVTLHLRALG